DLGPHLLHSEYRNMLALLERLGTRDRIAWQPEKLITFSSGQAVRHRALPPPFSLLPDMARASRLPLRDLWSNNRATWRALRFDEADVPALDRVDALTFLRAAGVSRRMIDWFWSFAALAVMNVPLERCSAAALMRVHSQLIGRRALHFGFPAVALSELFAPQAGRRIARVLLGAEVVRIANGVTLSDGAHIAADHVVCAVAPQDLRKLGGEAPAVEPSPYISCYLWFDRKLGSERFWAQLGGTTRLNTDFYDLSNIRRGWSDRASVVASNIIYCHRAQGMDDAEIVAATQGEIAAFAPQAARARVVHAVVNRIPMAIPCPLPGSESARPPPSASLAGDWTRTGLPCSMESAVRSGFMAAEEILQRKGIALAVRPADGVAGVVQKLRPRAARAPAPRVLPTAPRPRPRP
ncbi:MAG TPA: FAD-dependent oxidoreductase, partial [Burkholderiales bacterium]|nr:FAD-dependent oxidoreductase [Burkholderiales bacterium]